MFSYQGSFRPVNVLTFDRNQVSLYVIFNNTFRLNKSHLFNHSMPQFFTVACTIQKKIIVE